MSRKLLGETKVGLAVMEKLEDRVADGIRHCQNVNVKEGKPFKVTIEVTATPSPDRKRFTFAIQDKLSLPQHYAADATLHASVAGGEVDVFEFEPQIELPMGKIG